MVALDPENAALLAAEGVAVGDVIGVCGATGAKPKAISHYYGGKSETLAKWILQYFPPQSSYTRFVEGFGGVAGLMMVKPAYGIEVYNDLEDALVTLFEVVQNPVTCAELERRLALTPTARATWQYCYKNWKAETDPIARARMVYVSLEQSMSGRLENDGFAFGGPLHKPSTAVAFQRGLANIPAVSRRFRDVVIEHQDIFKLLDQWDNPDGQTLFYLDPPYPRSTRYRGTIKGHKNTYTKEMTEADHERLAARLLTLHGQVVLSGYDTAHYEPLEDAGWQKHSRPAKAASMVRTTGNGLKGTEIDDGRNECVWVKRHATYTLWQDGAA